MHKALFPREDIDRLYVSRKKVGRGLASIEDSVNLSIWLEKYLKKEQRKLIIVTRKKKRINRTTIIRKQKWEEKQRLEHFKR